jgi:predicted DNA-binding transcriptional regulator AlpA
MSDNTALPERNLTIEQFCEAEGFSVPHYYKLKKMGRGPRELRIGAVVRITPEARRDYHLANESLSGALAAEQAKIDAGLKRRAMAALEGTARPGRPRRA